MRTLGLVASIAALAVALTAGTLWLVVALVAVALICEAVVRTRR